MRKGNEDVQIRHGKHPVTCRQLLGILVSFFLSVISIISVISGLQTATKTVAFATKNINLRVKFLLRSPLATIYIYML